MIHVLGGALVGAVVGAASVLIRARLEGRAVDGRALLAVGAAGLVAGAVSAATLGAGGAATIGLARGVMSSAASGAAGGATHRLVTNLGEGRAPRDGVLESAATGAVVGGAVRGVSAALAPVGARLSEPARRALTQPAARLGRAVPAPLRQGAVTLRLSGRAAADAAGVAGSAYSVGAFAGATRRALDNAAHDRPLEDDVPRAPHDAGVDSVIRTGVGRVATPAVGTVLPSGSPAGAAAGGSGGSSAAVPGAAASPAGVGAAGAAAGELGLPPAGAPSASVGLRGVLESAGPSRTP